jgi:hypothetical protein
MGQKCDQCGIECLEGKGCVPVIEITEQLGKFMSANKQYLVDQTRSMQDHSDISKTFWEEQKKQVGELVAQVKECLEGTSEAALRFNDGHHRMEKNEGDIDGVGEKLRSHEDGKRGQHTVLAKSLGLIRKAVIVVFGLVGVTMLFVASQHPEFLGMLIKKIMI